MKRISIIIAAVFCLAGCEKLINTSRIIGTWEEYYDYPYFCMDGSVEYTFNEDGTYQIHSYDWLTHTQSTYTHDYTIDGNIITLKSVFPDSDYSTSYTITRLNRKEMSWQKVGTTYSPGTIGSDYLHFVRE